MYTYNDLLVDTEHLVRAGAKLSYIGCTEAGRMIPCFHVGSYCGPQSLIQGGIHAREYITCKLVVEQIYYFLRRYGNPVNRGIYFIPMVNIDGISLCQFGLQSVRNPDTRAFLDMVNGGSDDFHLWKANINAVDLNTNFPARWGTGALNVREPAPGNYIGPAPASERETRALMDITERVKPSITVSYHCKGQEIFWDFHQPPDDRIRDEAIGLGLAALTGYDLSESGASAGGYKDWCISRFAIPAYTIEIVAPTEPYPINFDVFPYEFAVNKEVPLFISNESLKL